ncbi:MAG: chemotaxis protein CheX [Candidatus Heimdallarchaeota archaeon]
MSAKDKEFDPQVIATTLMGCVQDTFKKMCNLTFSQDPDFVEKELIEYESRMRTFGLEKFNGPCYVAAISFYLSPKEIEEHDALGALVLYIEAEVAEKLLKALGYDFDEEDEDLVLDNCGEFCNVIAGQFKNQLNSLGYKDLTISAPIKGKNDIRQGVEFSYDQYKLYESSYYFFKKKALVVVATMSSVPQA